MMCADPWTVCPPDAIVIARMCSFDLASAMNIQYRQALQVDGPAVFELLWPARNEIPLRESFYSEANSAWITKECRRGRVWVADSDGLIVGMLYVLFNVIALFESEGFYHTPERLTPSG
jgi:hypothetical protein